MTIGKLLIIFVLLTTGVSAFCCSLPFLETSFFGRHSFNLFSLIEETLNDSRYQYIATGGIIAIAGAMISFICTLASFLYPSLLFGTFVFTVTGMMGAFIAVSEDLDYLASGFTAYEVLSVITVMLSIAAYLVVSREQPN